MEKGRCRLARTVGSAALAVSAAVGCLMRAAVGAISQPDGERPGFISAMTSASDWPSMSCIA